MAITATPLDAPLSYGILNQSAAINTLDEDMVRGPVTIYSIALVNANAETAYLKIFDSTGDGVTAGTDLPNIIIGPVNNETVRVDMPTGLALASGLTQFASLEFGNTATAPPTSLDVTYITNT